MCKLTYFIACAVAVFFSNCDESLPPREEPRKFLEASYTVSGPVVTFRDSSFQDLAGAFVVTAKNIYVEVLQDEESARVDIDLRLRDMPEQRGKVIATKRELTDPSLVFGGQLTLRPNLSATFLKQWEHKTTTGKHFWEFVTLTPKTTERGERYLESDSVRFVGSGKVQLFRTRAPEKLPPIQFTLVYRIF